MVLVPAMTSMFKPGFAADATVAEMHKRDQSHAGQHAAS
jgi:hypothetical protein